MMEVLSVENQATVWFIELLLVGVFSSLLLYLFYPAIVAARVSTSEASIPAVVLHPVEHSINQPPAVLSIVIPAYNEEARLTKMLTEAYDYLSDPKCPFLTTLSSHCVEWILVSDGSTDATTQTYQSFIQTTHSRNNNKKHKGPLVSIWKLIEFPNNRGKGAAVQAGMVNSTGAYSLMVDADGATDFGTALTAMAAFVWDGTVLLGSRPSETTKRSLLRKLLKSVFRLFVIILVGRSDIVDTQCGFKLFPPQSRASTTLFANLHLRRWAFDTELLYLCVHQYHYSILEVPVEWHEVDGSKLHTSLWNLCLSSLGMLRDMVCVRLCYGLRIWTIQEHDKSE